MTEENAGIEKNKLFVWNLHWNVRRQELKEFFWQRWEVAYASVALDRETRRSRWFWFVTFENEDDAAKAKESCKWETIQDREIFVEYARTRSDDDADDGDSDEGDSHEGLEGDDTKVEEGETAENNEADADDEIKESA